MRRYARRQAAGQHGSKLLRPSRPRLPSLWPAMLDELPIPAQMIEHQDAGNPHPGSLQQSAASPSAEVVPQVDADVTPRISCQIVVDAERVVQVVASAQIFVEMIERILGEQ